MRRSMIKNNINVWVREGPGDGPGRYGQTRYSVEFALSTAMKLSPPPISSYEGKEIHPANAKIGVREI